jgi:hypothetical protein
VVISTPADAGSAGPWNPLAGSRTVLKLWALDSLAAVLVGGGGWGRPSVGNLRWRQAASPVGNLRWRHASAGEESWLLPEAVPEDTPEVLELRVEAALELIKNGPSSFQRRRQY